MKQLLIFLFLCLAFGVLTPQMYAQQALYDTIYSNKGNLAVQVKEVMPEYVKFVYPNEDILISIYKNTIFKIKYRSGRVEVFSEATALQTVTSADDWEKVTIAKVEAEVLGLFKMGEVTTKAKGVTVFSNMDKVKDKAYKKMKIEAAMLGANTIFLVNEQVKGNQYGTEYEAGNTTETSLTGIAYSNTLPNFQDFKAMYDPKKIWRFFGNFYIGRNSTEIEIDRRRMVPSLQLSDVRQENGFIYVSTSMKETPGMSDFRAAYKELSDVSAFRVTYFDAKRIVLMYNNDGIIHNIVLVQ